MVKEFAEKTYYVIDRIVLVPFLHVCSSIYLCSCEIDAEIDACLLINVSFDVFL